MLPALYYNILKLLVCALAIILVPILGFVFADDIQKFLNENAKDGEEMPTVLAFVTFVWTLLAIYTGLFEINEIL